MYGYLHSPLFNQLLNLYHRFQLNKFLIFVSWQPNRAFLVSPVSTFNLQYKNTFIVVSNGAANSFTMMRLSLLKSIQENSRFCCIQE